MRLAVARWMVAALSSALGPRPAVDVGSGVEIRPTKGMGLGAFATVDLGAGLYLGQYTGKLYSPSDAEEATSRGKTSGRYFAVVQALPGVDGPLVVDAEDETTSAWPRYINHSGRRANCENTELSLPFTVPDLVDLGKLPLGLYVRTTRDISAGEELLLDYGEEYWRSRGSTPIED